MLRRGRLGVDLAGAEAGHGHQQTGGTELEEGAALGGQAHGGRCHRWVPCALSMQQILGNRGVLALFTR
ncbi:hypothetical protein AQPW35_40400 [Rubrivivax pictus]|uniref:Uncharacterized protein n=1 Tax=Pseudaquabacterium pictum TaxID=2315236 RepID=A0A480ATD6_9BURK|nr:hypothetical protein AQPW35_40400 [Rubrivivax pictus]